VGIHQLTHYIVVGGAGFIGSHFCDHLLTREETSRVTVYDNFTSGSESHIAHHRDDDRFHVVRGDVGEQDKLLLAMEGQDVVIHLAANPDIALAATDPDIDFREGTVLTRNVLEAMRQTQCRRILYASGSGVYGDLGLQEMHEDQGGFRPVSTYGASKLACESMISSYCHMVEFTARCFRFANVVGPRQTHGVGFDFVRRLREDVSKLAILGDGRQSKSYLHVDDTVSAVMTAHEAWDQDFGAFNVATGDYITVKEIAHMSARCVGLDPASVTYEFSGGNRGWKGDVPIMRLNSDRIRSLGWSNKRNSAEAMESALVSMLDELETGGR
jgi:UDP-glucose 4-epimerase